MASRREYWVAERQHILERLRERAPDLVRELEACEAALDKLGDDVEPPSDEYARHYHAWQAVVAYLDKRKRPAEEETIIHGVLEGGWMRGNDRAHVNLKNSIRYHIRESDNQKVLKKFRSGRIGLFGWSTDYDRG